MLRERRAVQLGGLVVVVGGLEVVEEALLLGLEILDSIERKVCNGSDEVADPEQDRFDKGFQLCPLQIFMRQQRNVKEETQRGHFLPISVWRSSSRVESSPP